MRVEQLNEGIWAMTYLVECESSAKATLIDPVWDNMSDYLSVIEERASLWNTLWQHIPMLTT